MPVELTRLGRTGLNVSRLGLGVMNFGSELTEAKSFEILDRAAELGINFVDTADTYPIPQSPTTWGMSETIVGRWLKGKRDSVVLATKCGSRVGSGANDFGGSRKHIMHACEKSLRRLGTDYIDVFYLHLPELGAPIEESLEALDRLVQSGKVHYIGLSNFSTWQVALAMEAIACRRLARVAVIQERYNLVARKVDRDLLALANAAGMGIVAYNPLGGGILAGMIGRGNAEPATGRFTMKLYQDRYLNEAVYEMADTVRNIAHELGCSSAQVALSWVLQQPQGIIPLVGAMHPDHLSDSVKALELNLPPDVMERLTRQSGRFRDS